MPRALRRPKLHEQGSSPTRFVSTVGDATTAPHVLKFSLYYHIEFSYANNKIHYYTTNMLMD
jgi:hypothetical protein